MPYRFDLDESVQAAFDRCGREQLERAQSSLTVGLERDPVEAIHDARKAIKKQRALLRLVRGGIRGAERRRENEALRDAARRVSATRDADAMIAALANLSERYAGQVPKALFDAAHAHLARRRDHDHGLLTTDELAGPAARELDDVRRRLESTRLRRHGWDAIGGGVLRTYARGRRALHRASAERTPENLHEWRKRAKDLWYQLRLLGPAGGHAASGQVKDVHALADLLGDDHDLAVLRETLIGAAGEIPADLAPLLVLLDHRRDQLQTEAIFLGERIYAESPKAFEKRMRAYWRAGRAGARAMSTGDNPAGLAAATRTPVTV